MENQFQPTSIQIYCQTPERLERFSSDLQAIGEAQNLSSHIETLEFLIGFHKCFNALLLRGEATREAKQFIKDESGWVEPNQIDRSHILTVAQQLRILADTLEA